VGDEITSSHFTAADFSAFHERLSIETDAINDHFRNNRFSPRGETAGFELEAWLVDPKGSPAPVNNRFLETLDNPLVVPELAAFNVELNGSPTSLSGRVFTRLHDELAATWKACCECADDMGYQLVTIGILPTVSAEQLNSQHMSDMKRYHAINDQVMSLRDGAPLQLNIDGRQPLALTHQDVMIEAAATSFQVHLQCRPAAAVRAFNAALVASAPLVAVSCNSPFLFGHELWSETRIPLFEQAVNVGPGHPQRVGFGTGYIRESLFECFLENLEAHPVLLPVLLDEPPHQFAHLRFHNGTIWRWNRPLIGFDFDGQPHLRIEHRVIPAGPTITDCIANAAFYYGLVQSFAADEEPIEGAIDFDSAKANFYAAARAGLDADLVWSEGERIGARQLILERLLPAARRALTRLNIPRTEIDQHLDIIQARADSGQTGAEWQRNWVRRHGPDMAALTLAYHEAQQSDEPVGSWSNP
jgi:gamma-glutamyl:cysteine ligase YbdK (ATP-grasp superfamily)